MTLTVITPAASYDLATLEQVKRQLQYDLDDGSLDTWLEEQISDISEMIANYVGRQLVQETVEETLLIPSCGQGEIYLERWPVSSMTSLTFDGTAWVQGTDYALSPTTGVLKKLSGTSYGSFWNGSMVVRYVGGFNPIPRQVSRAVAMGVKNTRDSQAREDGLKAERLEMVSSQQWFSPKELGAAGGAGLPSSVTDLVDYLRLPRI